jgi:S1-C subfamily serine protease
MGLWIGIAVGAFLAVGGTVTAVVVLKRDKPPTDQVVDNSRRETAGRTPEKSSSTATTDTVATKPDKPGVEETSRPDRPKDPMGAPVDPPTKPVDPPTKPVDPPTKPVDPPIKPADPPSLTRIDGALPAVSVAELKAATVFIRVEKAKVAAASGSGFFIGSDGDTSYVVTNHHVVHLTQKVERKVGRIVRPPIGRPIGPPKIEYHTETVEIEVPIPDITLVLDSGTPKERSVRAEVLAADADVDLAILTVKGLTNPPKAIDLKSPEPAELMPVVVLGFPFGKKLAIEKDNPAITVNRAAISSVRIDKTGAVRVIQLDGSINPGNSGGPVVDEKGKLIGVVVAKISNTNIGMAIPNQEVHAMLGGRVGEAKLALQKADKDTIDVQVEAPLIDPMGQVKSATLSYAVNGTLTESMKKDGLDKSLDSKTVELRRDKQKMVGTLRLPVTEKGTPTLLCQVSYVNGQGKTLRGEIKPATLAGGAPSTETPTVQGKGLEQYERAEVLPPAPFPSDPALAAKGANVFLSDMREYAWKPGYHNWIVGKGINGNAADQKPIRVNGTHYQKGLGMHPPNEGFTRICYALGKRASTLQGAIGLSEDDPTPPRPIRFVIMGDGKVLWRSESVRAWKVKQDFSVDVSSVDVLELRVYAENGSAIGSHAAWLDPFVMTK